MPHNLPPQDAPDARAYVVAVRDVKLKELRKGKRGRPYQPCKHYTRTELSAMRDLKILEMKRK